MSTMSKSEYTHLMEYWVERKKRGCPEREYDEVERAVEYVHDYCEREEADISEVDRGDLRGWIHGIYDYEYADYILDEIERYISYRKNGEFHGSGSSVTDLPGIDNAKEQEVVGIILDKLPVDTVYEKENKIITSENNRDMIIDIDVEKQYAIECKSSDSKSIVRGLSQCIFYSMYDRVPILCTPKYWDDLVTVCEDNDICLIFVDTGMRSIDVIHREDIFYSIFNE